VAHHVPDRLPGGALDPFPFLSLLPLQANLFFSSFFFHFLLLFLFNQ
jgi:hypothetical protein